MIVKRLTRLWTGISIALIVGLGLALAVLDGTARAESPVRDQAGSVETAPPLEPQLNYARVLTGGVPVYSHPLEALLGLSPARFLDTGYVWVSLPTPQSFKYGNFFWYTINHNEYVQADYLELYQPSGFQGMVISEPTTFAWIVFDTWTAAVPGQNPGDTSQLLKRYTVVPILGSQPVGDRTWYLVSEGHWVEQGMVGLITPKPRPEGVAPHEKWIEVDLYEQTLTAYEGDRMVYATLISSGLPYWKTETGLFRVRLKVDQGKMSGRESYADYYFLEDVPWTMYFHEGYALHGAYWHDSFGKPHSHGCVNMALADARWLFDWTEPAGRQGWSMANEKNPGTWVWVHD